MDIAGDGILDRVGQYYELMPSILSLAAWLAGSCSHAQCLSQWKISFPVAVLLTYVRYYLCGIFLYRLLYEGCFLLFVSDVRWVISSYIFIMY